MDITLIALFTLTIFNMILLYFTPYEKKGTRIQNKTNNGNNIKVIQEDSRAMKTIDIAHTKWYKDQMIEKMNKNKTKNNEI